MAVTVEELAARMDRMERELRAVHGKVQELSEPRASETEGENPLKKLKITSRHERQASAAAAGSIAEKMTGARLVLIGREALQDRFREAGYGGDNRFSQMVREMREE